MQEDYAKQLKAAEESRVKALEEQKQLYEAKLLEKTQLLAQVSVEEHMVECEVKGRGMKPVKFSVPFYFVQYQEDAQQQISEFKEIIRQEEEVKERLINNIKIKYERQLLTQQKTNTNLKGETGIMTQKVSKHFFKILSPYLLVM